MMHLTELKLACSNIFRNGISQQKPHKEIAHIGDSNQIAGIKSTVHIGEDSIYGTCALPVLECTMCISFLAKIRCDFFKKVELWTNFVLLIIFTSF